MIEAVGDLLVRFGQKTSKEDFFHIVGEKKLTSEPTGLPPAGEMSLSYAVVEAKVQSERPWPFDSMVNLLSATLGNTERRIGHSLAARHPEKAEAFFLKNRLIDLSLGLQLFYQRALSGQKFTPAQLQIWRDWLDDVRKVLNLIAGIGPAWSTHFYDAERVSWLRAQDDIEQDAAVLQDAATSSALSVVMLAEHDGGAGSADCLAARSLYNFAAKQNLDGFFSSLHFAKDEKATYRGLLEQMNNLIEGGCKA